MKNWCDAFSERLFSISYETLTFSLMTTESLAGVVWGRVAWSRSVTSPLDCRHRFCSRLRWCCQSNRCRSFCRVAPYGTEVFEAERLSSTAVTCEKSRETWLTVTLETKRTFAESVIYTRAGMLMRFQPQQTADGTLAETWRVGRSWLNHPQPVRSAPKRSRTTKTRASCSSSESQWQMCSCHRLRRARTGAGESCRKSTPVRPDMTILREHNCLPVEVLRIPVNQSRVHRFRVVHFQIPHHCRIFPRLRQSREALEVLPGQTQPQPVREDRWVAPQAPGIEEVGVVEHSAQSWLLRYPNRCLGRIPCRTSHASRSSRDGALHSNPGSYPLHTTTRITYNPKPIFRAARTFNPISLSFHSHLLFTSHHESLWDRIGICPGGLLDPQTQHSVTRSELHICFDEWRLNGRRSTINPHSRNDTMISFTKFVNVVRASKWRKFLIFGRQEGKNVS